MNNAEMTSDTNSGQKVVIATTVALTFITFWRAAAVVLGDLGSSLFYAGGIAEEAAGPSAAWLVLGVMFFTFAVRAVYTESCSMFVRGGVYVVVRDSMGPFVARLSVSALLFDYLLTGPISSVSAGHYIGRLINDLLHTAGFQPIIQPGLFSVLFAVAVTIFFWWNNIKGIHESSSKALRIIQITTVMVVVLLVWCPITLLMRHNFSLPPAPLPSNYRWGEAALGWFNGGWLAQLSGVAMIIAFGHAFLSMSGFETLAQVYREVAQPKLANLRRTGLLVCVYALLSTGVITLFAAMIIPASVRASYHDNLISGLVMFLNGPLWLRLAFQGFVVVVGAMILSAAVNTSIIGANAVLNRVAEDGVLLPWFRKPHPRYGTSSRLINLITALQIFTILWSGGDVYLLGEAYAFGVVWSFALKSLGVLVLRHQRHDQEYKVPLNIRWGNRELPIGLILTTTVLFLVASANLISKQVATIYGGAFTVVFFIMFSISEHLNHRRKKAESALEEFNLDRQAHIGLDSVGVSQGSALIAVRDPNTLHHLQWALENPAYKSRPLVVMTVRVVAAGTGEYDLSAEQYFGSYERKLFSRVVTIAEKAGRTVKLLVVPGVNSLDAMVQTAAHLKSSSLVVGESARMSVNELARKVGLAWEWLTDPRPIFSLVVIGPDRKPHYVNLGPHTPRLSAEDVERVHYLWLKLTNGLGFSANLHHRDVVSVALRRLQRDLEGERKSEVVADVEKTLHSHGNHGSTRIP